MYFKKDILKKVSYTFATRTAPVNLSILRRLNLNSRENEMISNSPKNNRAWQFILLE